MAKYEVRCVIEFHVNVTVEAGCQDEAKAKAMRSLRHEKLERDPFCPGHFRLIESAVTPVEAINLDMIKQSAAEVYLHWQSIAADVGEIDVRDLVSHYCGLGNSLREETEYVVEALIEMNGGKEVFGG